MSRLDDHLAGELSEWRDAGLLRGRRGIGSAQGPRIVVDGRACVNFSSNDYLGLANDPVLVQAAQDAIRRYGVGAGASRLVCGNIEPYRQLEEALAYTEKVKTGAGEMTRVRVGPFATREAADKERGGVKALGFDAHVTPR